MKHVIVWRVNSRWDSIFWTRRQKTKGVVCWTPHPCRRHSASVAIRALPIPTTPLLCYVKRVLESSLKPSNSVIHFSSIQFIPFLSSSVLYVQTTKDQFSAEIIFQTDTHFFLLLVRLAAGTGEQGGFDPIPASPAIMFSETSIDSSSCCSVELVHECRTVSKSVEGFIWFQLEEDTMIPLMNNWLQVFLYYYWLSGYFYFFSFITPRLFDIISYSALVSMVISLCGMDYGGINEWKNPSNRSYFGLTPKFWMGIGFHIHDWVNPS